MMKLTQKGKIVFGSLFTAMFVVLNGVVGLPPAFTPTRAEALVAIKQYQKATLAKYQNSDSLSDQQLVELLSAVGFEGQSLRKAWAVAKKESNGQPLHYNGNRKTGDSSYGVFQINMIGGLGADRREKFGLKSNAELLNPVVNAQVAYHMSNGGKNWGSWKGMTARTKAWLAKFPESKAKAIAKAKAKAIAEAKAQ
jgi:Lysozyme like domain